MPGFSFSPGGFGGGLAGGLQNMMANQFQGQQLLQQLQAAKQQQAAQQQQMQANKQAMQINALNEILGNLSTTQKQEFMQANPQLFNALMQQAQGTGQAQPGQTQSQGQGTQSTLTIPPVSTTTMADLAKQGGYSPELLSHVAGYNPNLVVEPEKALEMSGQLQGEVGKLQTIFDNKTKNAGGTIKYAMSSPKNGQEAADIMGWQPAQPGQQPAWNQQLVPGTNGNYIANLNQSADDIPNAKPQVAEAMKNYWMAAASKDPTKIQASTKELAQFGMKPQDVDSFVAQNPKFKGMLDSSLTAAGKIATQNLNKAYNPIKIGLGKAQIKSLEAGIPQKKASTEHTEAETKNIKNKPQSASKKDMQDTFKQIDDIKTDSNGTADEKIKNFEIQVSTWEANKSLPAANIATIKSWLNAKKKKLAKSQSEFIPTAAP
jgi:hypothetical protein